MNDPEFGRPVGLQIFNLIKSGVTSLNTELKGTYTDIVSATWNRTTSSNAFWVLRIQGGMDICDSLT